MKPKQIAPTEDKEAAEAILLINQLDRMNKLKDLGMEEGLSELFYSLNGSEVRVIINTLPEMTNSQFNIFFELIAEEIKVIKDKAITSENDRSRFETCLYNLQCAVGSMVTANWETKESQEKSERLFKEFSKLLKDFE